MSLGGSIMNFAALRVLCGAKNWTQRSRERARRGCESL